MKKFFVEFSTVVSQESSFRRSWALNWYIRRFADPRSEVDGSVFAKCCELAEYYVLTVYSQKSVSGNFFPRPHVNGGAVPAFFYTATLFKPIM